MRTFTAFILLLLASLAQAGPADLNPILQPILDMHKLPGMAGAIVHGDRVIAIGAVGIRKRGSVVPVSIDDEFHLGSCTKAMTATLCAILVEEHKLRWDTKLVEVFPELRGKMDENWRQVTLEHLLTHRSGLPDDRKPTPLLTELRKYDSRPQAGREFLLQQLIKQPLENPPGTKFAYSNFGYTLAGHMAERIARKPYEELMREKLFTPLHMASAGFGPPGKRDAIEQPWGHSAAGQPRFGDNPLVIAPGGCVHASIADWARFVALHTHCAPGQARLLQASTFEKLHTPVDRQSNDAMGWFVVPRPWASGDALNHNGTNTEWFADVWIAPKRDFAVLVACNQGGPEAEKACDEVAGKLIQEFNRIGGK